MPLPHALRQLYRTGRVYRDDTTLIDPRTGATAPRRTIGSPWCLMLAPPGR